jgi:cation diffusion facilitator CzcD-associated flavoprotein CzcO
MARQLGGTDDELLDVVVIGGSQAGLAMAWHLARQHLRFVVLEAGPEPGHTWRSRWDSLTLFTPAQYAALPGMPFPGPPDTYPTKEQVAGYLDAYAAEFNLPVRLNARVTALILTAEGFEARTDDGVFRARQVVVATGPFQAPHVPPIAQRLDGSVTQLHSAGYRNPRTLPPGPVLVVGGGNSGFQIAGELAATRQVDLVPVVERYFEFVQRTVDISRNLTLRWAEAAGTLSGAVREQAESMGGLVREQADSARDFVHEQAGKAEQADREQAEQVKQAEQELAREARKADREQVRRAHEAARQRYEGLTKAELSDLLDQRNLPKTGNVDELVERLVEADSK